MIMSLFPVRGNFLDDKLIESVACKYSLKESDLFKRALFKFHYMRECPVLNSWSSVIFNFGKTQEEGKFAGNFIGSSETIREAIYINDKFKWWLIGFTEGDDDPFITDKNGDLEFKITLSSNDAQILFFIKKELKFGSVSIQDKINKTHHYKVKDKKNILKLIRIFNGNLLTKHKVNQFKLSF